MSGLCGAFIEATDVLKYKKQRQHRLLILSCYIDFDAVKRLINQVAEQVRLSKVRLAFEFLEAFRSRLPNETLDELKALRAWCKSKSIALFWYPVRTGSLMHAKGYALIQQQGANKRSGIVCVGSGNATLPGLGLSKRAPVNIEMASISTSDDDLSEFIRCWNVLMKHTRRLSDAAHREDEYEFAYSLLASGVFLHDWRDSIGAQVGIKFTLTKEGQKQLALNDPELQSLGFKAEQATISSNPFSAVAFPRGRALPRGFSKNYTIDTLLGRWCPKSIWGVVEQAIERDEEFKTFLDAFRKATAPESLSQVVAVEEAKSNRLADRGVVTRDPERVARWRDKIEMLRDNQDKLARIFMKLEPFDLPYDYQSRREIEELRDSLLQTMAVKSRRFLASRKVAEAEEQGDLKALELTDEEHDELKDVLANYV